MAQAAVEVFLAGVVSFAGGRGVSVGGGAVVQEVDVIAFTPSGATKPERRDAVGECSFRRPPRGRFTVACSADTEQGVFRAEFQTDGSEPDVLQLPPAEGGR